MASELAHQQISLDMFVFVQPGQQIYKNLATMGDLPKFASGNLYYYPGFNARTHGMKFSNELYDNLTRKIAWEAVFRIRLSEGFKQIGSYGNILIKQKTADLLALPTVDSDRTFIYEISRGN